MYAKPSIALLSSLDVLVRYYVRRWLHLPKNVTNSLIHSPVRFGGFGVHRLRTFVPYLREGKFSAVHDSIAGFGLNDIVREVVGGYPTGVVGPRPGYKEVRTLYAQVDGVELVAAGDVTESTAWISRVAESLTGQE